MGVISPLLANLSMHYAFDHWLEYNIDNVWFERFADDAVSHCHSKQEACVHDGSSKTSFTRLWSYIASGKDETGLL